MGQKTQPPSAEGAGQCRLRWSRVRLDTELAQQISAGEVIGLALAAPTALDSYEDVSSRFKRWHERNLTILEQAFTRSVIHEYQPYTTARVSPVHRAPPTAQEKIQKTLSSLRDRVGRLNSLRDRLDLFGEEGGVTAAAPAPGIGQTVFIVHGRDPGAKHEVARTIEQITGRPPVILHEQPDGGRTIIEKFEDFASDAGAAVVILTPDDEGRLKSPGAPLEGRARQNVVYELGWFHGRLGRGRVIALLQHGVESPSDLHGVLYLQLDSGGTWKPRLGLELRAAGIEADLNNLTL